MTYVISQVASDVLIAQRQTAQLREGSRLYPLCNKAEHGPSLDHGLWLYFYEVAQYLAASLRNAAEHSSTVELSTARLRLLHPIYIID